VNGTYSAKFNAFLGKVTEDGLSGLRADICFISTPAVSGLDVYHMDDTVVRAKRAMLNSGALKVLLVNHTRFGSAALHRLAGLDEFDRIITDTAPSREICSELDRAGLTLTFADTKEATT